ncbi:HD-GYP domain-containing protein [Sulfuricurvum sp.]|uniref:HD-GYP domain-containing protein n=1 Tax=Sulfuricurvum sp. TaxID=2025608 RepID=UPI002D357A79|nr:HD domain-containing phosphohydrolase [Sulfuricurvum sp.]HZF69304.1 HD domain-containing phosphohydrolase [Sulfuricurvum sp.]
MIQSSAKAFKSYPGYKAFTIETILLDKPLGFTLYIDNGEKLIKYVHAEGMLQTDTKERLIQNDVDHFYIATGDSHVFDNYMIDNLCTVLNTPGMSKSEKSAIIYSSAIHVMQDMFESDISASKIMRVKELMHETIKRVISSEVTAASLLQLSTHDYKTYSHCVNVALYAIGIGHEYGLNEEELHTIASGAILHDVGKCRIDNCIINKPAKLTLEEFETIKDHPEHSHSILLENGETNPNILEIVLMHHEKLDGSGYTKGLGKNDISFGTQIVTVADIFDALTSNRSYKNAASFFVSLKTMKVQMKTQLNLELIDALIKMMGRA